MLEIKPIHFSRNNTLGNNYEKIAEAFNKYQKEFKELIKDPHIKQNIKQIGFYFTDEKLNPEFRRYINMVFNLSENIDLEQDIGFIICLRIEVFDHLLPFFEKFHKANDLGQITDKDVYVMYMSRLTGHHLVFYRVYNKRSLFMNPYTNYC